MTTVAQRSSSKIAVAEISSTTTTETISPIITRSLKSPLTKSPRSSTFTSLESSKIPLKSASSLPSALTTEALIHVVKSATTLTSLLLLLAIWESIPHEPIHLHHHRFPNMIRHQPPHRDPLPPHSRLHWPNPKRVLIANCD
uniref:Uncharacterized protein n=1 Tax=Arundo donax TaxID=35708 RepID=A0A0A9U528_ARUDO